MNRTADDVRSELLLGAFCALASSLPDASRRQIAAVLSARASELAVGASEAADDVLAGDLARLLGACGVLPAATHGDTTTV